MILTDPATLDTPQLERAIISARLDADTDPRLEAWADRAALILEQRRADEADCDLVEFTGMEFV